jgi:hypothetical protein
MRSAPIQRQDISNDFALSGALPVTYSHRTRPLYPWYSAVKFVTRTPEPSEKLLTRAQPDHGRNDQRCS